ncbi:MAG: hypothetical protein ACYS8W_17765 [Planctomycetota bacterium]
MASLGMSGPYKLSDAVIDNLITQISPGNYALGYTDDGGTFVVQYIGRSDDDLYRRLKEWVGSKYTKFEYSLAPGKKVAHEKECMNFHDFGGAEKLDNDKHPERPAGTDWKCPYC